MDDLTALVQLEGSCFEPERQDGEGPIRHSLRSPHQEVWVAEEETGGAILGAMTLRLHPRTCRIYSVAVDPAAQGKGIGRQLMEKALTRALKKGCSRIHLEVDARNKILIEWYQRYGYRPVKTLEHYYAKDWHGLRLALELFPDAPRT